MQIRFCHLIVTTIAIGFAGMVAGCASTKSHEQKEERVSIAQVSAPARATIERVTSGGQVNQITKESERGRTVYDVEATVGGRHLEFTIGDSDGAVLGTEVPIGFGELPQPVQSAAEEFFGTTSGLTSMKGVEYGETQYEIEGPKNGKTVEMTFNPAGQRVQ